MINNIFVGFILGCVFVYYYPQEGGVVVDYAVAAVTATVEFVSNTFAKIG
jgi:hypothetical protein